MKRLLIAMSTALFAVGLCLGSVTEVLAQKHPVECLQAQKAYQKSQMLTNEAIALMKSFAQLRAQAIKLRAQAIQKLLEARKQFNSSKTSYNNLKLQLSKIGINLSPATRLSQLRKQQNISPSNLPNPQISNTKSDLQKAKNLLQQFITLNRLALQLYRNAKRIGDAARKKAADARLAQAETLRLITQCQAKMGKRTQLIQPNPQSRRCGQEDQSIMMLFCIPDEYMSSNGRCFNLMGWQSSTQTQSNRLNQEEASAMGAGGQNYFEIDMRTTEAQTDQNSAQTENSEVNGMIDSLK
jgi:hypothetical protein